MKGNTFGFTMAPRKRFPSPNSLRSSEASLDWEIFYEAPLSLCPSARRRDCRSDFLRGKLCLMDKLFSIGISTRPSTHAVHMLTYYKKKYSIEPEDFPNAFAANDCSISFPLFNGMSLEEQDFVIDNVLAEKFDIAM